MNNLKSIAKIIKKSKSVALFTHKSADFDALGSACSLCLALKRAGKNAKVFLNDELLPNQKELYDDFAYFTEFDNNEYDLYIVVDTSGKSLLGKFDFIAENESKTVVIDHHATKAFAVKNYYGDSSKSSCCEIIFSLLKMMKCNIDSTIASYLYAGLSTDSGSFRNSNTNENSLITAYQLLKCGADIKKINNILYESTSLKELELEKYLLNNYQIKDNCAYCCFEEKILKKYNATKDDCAYFSRILVNIKEVLFSFTLIEIGKGEYKLSLRSKAGYNIKNIAVNLGGGGHACAAGATIFADNSKQAIDIVLNSLKDAELE